MVDNIKFNILDNVFFEQNLKCNSEITLKSTYCIQTGVPNDYPKIGRLHNLEIRITPKNATIKGSMHRYYNLITGKGDHNYNDFSFSQWEIAINHLCQSLCVNKEKTKITNLEFGFNIETFESPKFLIENHVLMYNFQDHNRKHKYRGRGSYKEFEKSDYSFKVYDKSKQYQLENGNILRVELKMTSSRYIQRLGVFNLNQLGKNAFKSMFKSFLGHFNKLMLIDSLNAPKGIRTDQMILFKLCISSNHWDSINEKEKKESKREFNKIIKKTNYNKKHSLLRDSIIEKYGILINQKS